MNAEVRTPRWTFACRRDDLVPNTGGCVLLGGEQVALYRLVDPHTGDEHYYALGNVDPFSGAAVLARGLLCGSAEEPYVASPMYKQRFALRTGVCLDDPTVRVISYPVRSSGEWLVVGPAEPAS